MKTARRRVVIDSNKKSFHLGIQDLVLYKDLLYFMTFRGIKAKYAQSILGVSWAIIQPLATTLIFTVVFGRLAKVDSAGMPYLLFSFAAMVPWTYFSGVITDASNSLVQNSNLLSKVYFPRLILPLSASLAKTLDFLISMLVLGCLLLIYQIAPSWDIVFLPLLLCILLATSLGLGMILSAMSVKYRDVKHALAFLVQLLMYGTPVVYSAYALPVEYQWIYSLNPMVGVIEGFRSVFLGVQPFPWLWVANGGAVAVVCLFAGIVYFRRMESTFSDIA